MVKILPNHNLNKIDVLFVIFEVELLLENSAVFQSQVIDQMIALREMGLNLAICTPYKSHERFIEVAGNLFAKLGIKIFVIKKRNFILTFISMIFLVHKVAKNQKVRKCYVRGLWGPLIIFASNPFKRLKYIYDVRGDLHDELLAVNTSWLKKNIYLIVEKLGIRFATNITAVTKVLLRKVKSNAKSSHVIPCCIDFKKFRSDKLDIDNTRKALGFKMDDIVFVYSGGLSHYQQVSAMLQIWLNFINNPRIKFLLLTNEDPHSHPLTLKEGVLFGDRLTHKNLPRELVPKVLASSDIAFMLRENRPLNRSASPVKFPEYLSAGLAVVASPGIGDISDLILEENIGILVDPTDIVSSIYKVNDFVTKFEKEGKSKFSIKAHQIVIKHYDWAAYKRDFSLIYC